MHDHVFETMRFYADVRWKQMTVWLAAMTLCAAGVTQLPPDSNWAPGLPGRVVAALVALVFTAVTCIIEVSAARSWLPLRSSVSEEDWPRARIYPRWVNGTNAMLALYGLAYWGWLWSMVQWGASTAIIWSVVVFGFALVVYVICNFRELWRFKGPSSPNKR